MPTVRVRQDVSATVWSEDDLSWIALIPGRPYDQTDPLVRANPWAFESDVEAATSRPGEKRSVRRPIDDAA